METVAKKAQTPWNMPLYFRKRREIASRRERHGTQLDRLSAAIDSLKLWVEARAMSGELDMDLPE